MLQIVFSQVNKRDDLFRCAVFLISACPFIYLAYGYFLENLGLNPFEVLISFTGFNALIFLLLCLAITPLRRWLTWYSKLFKWQYGKRLVDWNFLIKTRRMMGLYAFSYACLHFFIYAYFDQGLEWEYLFEDVFERSFLMFGLAGLILLVPLTVTSPMAVRRRMGRGCYIAAFT